MAYQTVTKWITPPEAEGIAREFEKQANIAYDLAAKLMRIKDDLDYNWEGNSKNKFMASYDGSPSKVNNYANELRARANEIRNIKVSVTENVWVPDPVEVKQTPTVQSNTSVSSGDKKIEDDVVEFVGKAAKSVIDLLTNRKKWY